MSRDAEPGDGGVPISPVPPRRRRRKRYGTGVGAALGAAMVELEQQILRGRPRTEERYQRRDEISTTAGDGSRLSIELPPEPPAPVPADAPSSKAARRG